MDSEEGDQHEPQSLHLYLYCQGDPINNTDPSGNEIEGLMAAMDVGSILAGISSPVTTRSATKAIALQYRFKVVTGRNFSLGATAAWSDTWGQPKSYAQGFYIIGRNQASSWVAVTSRDNGGGTCNTVDLRDGKGDSGTIILYARAASPGTAKMSVYVRMQASVDGPYGRSAVTLKSGYKVLFDDKATNGNDVYEERPYVFDAPVGVDWTPVLEYIPTVATSQDHGQKSKGRANGMIML